MTSEVSQMLRQRPIQFPISLELVSAPTSAWTIVRICCLYIIEVCKTCDMQREVPMAQCCAVIGPSHSPSPNVFLLPPMLHSCFILGTFDGQCFNEYKVITSPALIDHITGSVCMLRLICCKQHMQQLSLSLLPPQLQNSSRRHC